MDALTLFDTHTHLCDARFDEDREAVIARMREAGVALALVIGDGSADPSGAYKLADQHNFLYAAAGVHPHDASKWDGARADLIKKYMAHPKAAALGEIGLDFHYDHSPRDAQRTAFEAQLDLALELGKPVIIHIREAHGEAIERLSARHKAGRLPRGVMHCYTGSLESARLYIDMGMYISLSGAVTFKNAPKLWEIARHIPLERLLIETDCPYMAPVPMRGKRNEPAHVRYVAEKIAALRGIPAEAMAAAALKNGKELFNIDENAL
jgi:TatD DNase family protein